MSFLRPLIILFLLPFIVTSQEGRYTVDLEKSAVEFEINHMGVLKVAGLFKEFEGYFNFENGAILSSGMAISVNSIFTDNKERDEIILTEPYLDSKSFPNINFNGKASKNPTDISGDLTIKGNTRSISFPYKIEYDEQTDAFIFSGETSIKRKEFDLIFGSMNGLIGNKIKIKLKVVARK